MRLILVSVLVSGMVTTAFVIGWLAFRQSRDAVNELAGRLQRETGSRVTEELRHLVGRARLINDINVNAIRFQQLEIENPDKLERYFWQQHRSFPNMGFLSFGSTNGLATGVFRDPHDQGLRSAVMGRDKGGQGESTTLSLIYALDENGRRVRLERSEPGYDCRTRPWFKYAAEVGKPLWSPVYKYYEYSELAISLSCPVYHTNSTFLGVLTADFSLQHIGNYLRSIKAGENGITFIMERDGMLVADSKANNLFEPKGEGEIRRLSARESKEILVRSSAEHLQRNGGKLRDIRDAAQSVFMLNGARHFLQVIPFQDDAGIDWLVAIVIPESDFMARIIAGNRQAMLLSLVALMGAIFVGVYISQRLTSPIFRMRKAFEEVAAGKLEPVSMSGRVEELTSLTESFNEMTRRLKQSFALQEEMNRTLEQRVKERTQELANAIEQKDRLLSIIGHDLRTPLFGLVTLSELMSERPEAFTAEKISQYAAEMHISAKSLLELLENLLDWAQIQTQQKPFTMEPQSLADLAKPVVNLFLLRARLKDIQIEQTIPKDLTVLADTEMIRTVLRNLLSNAIKFTARGGTVRLTARNGEDEMVVVSVSDNGIGLDPEKCATLFTAKLSSLTRGTENEVGVGLGLLISRQFVEQHQGRIWVESVVKKGSSFHFELLSAEEENSASE